MTTKIENKKVAIVGLTRGYNGDLDKYDDLIKRNHSIYKNLNSKLKTPYRLILFHEGNISPYDQKYITDNSPELIEFISVEKLFKKFKDIEESDGYKIMCKFQMYYIWDYVKEYDYIVRIDEDIFLNEIDIESVKYMEDHKIDFLYSKLSYESHVPTNKTLPDFIKKLFTTNNTKFYNHLFPYTNFYISKTNFWNKEEIKNKLQEIAESRDQILYRWGDLPVIGCVLNIEKAKFGRIKKLSYYHSSHNLLVKNNIFSLINETFHYKRFVNMYPNTFKSIKKILKQLKPDNT